MKATFLTLAGTLALLAVWLGCSGPAKALGDEPPRAEKAAPPKSLILELQTDRWGSWGWGHAEVVKEVRAKPGDTLGNPGEPAFTLVEIIDKDHVLVRAADYLAFKDGVRRIANEEILTADEGLTVTTATTDDGTDYTIRISKLDEVPVVKADDPKVIAAIAAHANVTVDDAGSIQEIGPPGVVAPGGFAHGGTGFDPAKLPTDEDMKNIGKLNNLRRLFLPGSAITDAGAVHLKNLTRLRELDLSKTKIGDATLPYLARLKQLETLNLWGTDISDKGVKTLQGLKFPEAHVFPGRRVRGGVELRSTKITREGFWQLAQAPPPCFDPRRCDRLWGNFQGVGPEHVSGGKTEREKRVFRLLVLGCNLEANAAGDITEASFTMTSPQSRHPCYHTKEQTREVFDLLAKLGSIERLVITQPFEQHLAALDDDEAALISNLRQLKYLGVQGCWLPDAAWKRLTGLTQLGELDLERAIISGARLRSLREALPNCKIRGRPSIDEKNPVNTAPPAVVLAQLCHKLPSRSDQQIIEALRGYCVIDSAADGGAADWLAKRLQAARKQWEAVQAIERAEGRVYYDSASDESGEAPPTGKPSAPARLRELLGDDFFDTVLAAEANVASERSGPEWHTMFHAIERLSDLPHLRRVTIKSNDARDEELTSLKGLTELRTLAYRNSILGAQITHVGALTQLRVLHFSATLMRDEALEQLKGMTNLRELDLGMTALTDAGLEHLKGLTNLRALTFDSTKVSEEGVKELRKALPNCKISWSATKR